MDIVTLGLRVDGTAVKDATAELAKMGEQGGATEAKLRASLQRTISQIKEMQAAWKGARIGDTEFVQGVQRLQGEADATRSALAKLTLAQDAAKNATTGVGAAAEDTTLHMGKLRSVMGTLAAQAIGTNPALIQVASTLAMLGIGAGITVGILAALAAIAAALDHLKSEATKAQDAYDKFMDSLRKSSALAIVGAQLDAVQHKLDNMGPGFLGAATRLTRGILSRSLLGQMFGVQSEDELRAEAARLGTESANAFSDAQRVAREKVRADLFRAGLANEAPTQGLMAGFQTDQIQNIRNALKDLQTVLVWYTHPPDRNTIFKDLTQQGETAAETVRMVNAAIAGGAPVFMTQGGGAGQSGTGKIAGDAKEIANSWHDVAASVANVVTLLANADSASLQFLGTLVTAVGQVEAAIAEVDKVGKLSATSIAGLVATGVSLITQIFSGGESPAQKRSREIQEQNTEAIRKLTDVMTLQVTGAARATGTAATTALLGPAGNGIGLFAGAGGGLNTAAVNTILAAQGTTLAAYKDFAKSLGITLDTTNATTFINSLKALDVQLKQSELARFADSFGGAMELLNAQFKAFDTTDPLERLRQTVAVLTGKNGSDAFAGAFAGQDLAQQSNRAATIGNLQQILQQIAAGTFDTTQTGGLTLKEFVDQLTSTIDLLRQVDDTAKQRDDALQATIDTLQKFGNSLKLDGGLTTLSPVQQLEEARRQYQAVLAQAQAGDQAAAAQLPDAARTFLNASRAVNASGPAFAADFQAVLDQTDAIARLFATQKSQGDQMVAYTGELVYNTAALVDASKDQVAVLKEGFTTLKQQNDDMAAAIEQLIKETRAGAEGGRL